MDLSILVVSYNTKKLTIAALDSVLRSLKHSSLKYEILVFDNHSTDSSAEAIAKQFGKLVKVFKNATNIGFGRANNKLAKIAKGKALLLLNSDTEVIDRAIDTLWQFFQANSYHFVGGKLLNPDGSSQPSAGSLFSPLIAFIALFLRGDYWGITRSSPSVAKKVGWVSGACILTSRQTYLSLGGFDEGIFLYMEEIDLFKRAADKGLTVGFCPEARVIHYGFASSGSKSRPVINVFRGYWFYYQKHYSRFWQSYIRLLLKTKAAIGYTLGKVLGNQYLQQTYHEAIQVIKQMD